MAFALLLVQLRLQLRDIVAAILLLGEEQPDRQLGAVMVGGRRALGGDGLGDPQQLRVQPGAERPDLLQQLGAQPAGLGRILGRAGIAARRRSLGGRRAEQPGQQAGFGGGFCQDGLLFPGSNGDSVLPATER